jgi:hypothetical protein
MFSRRDENSLASQLVPGSIRNGGGRRLFANTRFPKLTKPVAWSSMHRAFAAIVISIGIVAPDWAIAQARPAVPSTAQPGRERQQLLDQPSPPTPRIQLQDGRPAPVIVSPDRKRPPKRKKSRRGSQAR